MADRDTEAMLAALRRWDFPETDDDPAFVEKAMSALRKIDEAFGVLFPEQLQLLATLDYASDSRRVAAFYFGCVMQAGHYIVADAKGGGTA